MKMRLEGIEQAQGRARFAFTVANVASVAFLIVIFTTGFSWIRWFSYGQRPSDQRVLVPACPAWETLRWEAKNPRIPNDTISGFNRRATCFVQGLWNIVGYQPYASVRRSPPLRRRPSCVRATVMTIRRRFGKSSSETGWTRYLLQIPSSGSSSMLATFRSLVHWHFTAWQPSCASV